MTINDVELCHVCKSKELKIVPNCRVEDQTSGDVDIVTALLCKECDTLHYCIEGKIEYEFSIKIADTVYVPYAKLEDYRIKEDE